MKIVKVSAYKPKIERGRISDPILKQVTKLSDELGGNSQINFQDVTSEDVLWQKLSQFVSSGKVKEILDKQRSSFKTALDVDAENKSKEELSYGDRSKLIQCIKNINTWEKALLEIAEDEDVSSFRKNPAFLYLISKCLLEHKDLPLYSPNVEALQLLKDQVIELEEPWNGKNKIRNVYNDIAMAQTAEDSEIAKISFESLQGWICIPGGNTSESTDPLFFEEDIRNIFPDKDFNSFSNRIVFTNTLCFGKGWCIGTPYWAESYLSDGMIWLYVVSGEPKVCIATKSGSKAVREITGANNQRQNTYIFADELIAFRKNHETMQSMIDKFQYTYRHGQSVYNFKEIVDAKEGILRVGLMTPDEIGQKFNQYILSDLDNSSTTPLNSFLLDSKIAECAGSEVFVKAATEFMLNINTGAEFEHHINRFPFTRKDPRVIQNGINFIKTSLTSYGKMPVESAVPSEANPYRLNDKLRSIPMKYSEVTELVFKAYMYLINIKKTNAQGDERFKQISNLISDSGFSGQMKDKAKEECLSSLLKGDLEKFNLIRMTFDLNTSMETFRDDHFDTIKSKSAKLLVDDYEAFKSLDEFMGGKLTEEETFVKIKAEALPYIGNKAISALSSSNLNLFKVFSTNFPNILTLPDVRSMAIQVAKTYIILDANRFYELDKIFSEAFTRGVEADVIISGSLVEAITYAKSFLRDQNTTKRVKELDTRFRGRILADEGVYNTILSRIVLAISHDNNELYLQLKSLYPEKIAEAKDYIAKELYTLLERKITSAYISGDIEEFKRLNKKTNNLAVLNLQEIISYSLGQAVTYAISNYANWEVLYSDGSSFDSNILRGVESEESDSKLSKLISLNTRYNNRLLKDPRLKSEMKEILLKCSGYKNSPYFDKLYKTISYIYKKLYNEQIINNKEVELYRQDQVRSLQGYVDSLLAEDKLQEVIRLVRSYGELAKVPRILFQAKRRVKREATPANNTTWTEEEKRERRNLIESLDMAFGGSILSDPSVSMVVNHYLSKSNNPEAKSWYNIAKFS